MIIIIILQQLEKLFCGEKHEDWSVEFLMEVAFIMFLNDSFNVSFLLIFLLSLLFLLLFIIKTNIIGIIIVILFIVF